MIDTREIRVGGYRWTIAPELSAGDVERLIDPSPERERGVQMVKHTPHRSVYRVQLPGLDLHVKHYGGGAREWWRCVFRGARAAREFAISREVARRGVPTLEVLGYGESERRFGPADSYLITRTLPGVEPLLDYLEADRPCRRDAKVQHRVARAVGALVARQHLAGVRHDDLHPGNILLRFDAGEPHLYLIDLDNVRLGPPLDWRASRDNLVVLDRWFALRFSRGDRRRALRAYCLERRDLALDERQVASELAKATAASLLHHTRQLDDRCRGGNRHFTRLSVPGLVGHAVRDIHCAALLADPDAALSRNDVKILKRSASSVVAELPPGRILKRVAGDPIASLFRPPPALRSYLLGHAFRLRGLPTPRPLAVWHRRRLGMSHEGYLLVEKAPDAHHLRGFVEMLSHKPAAERNDRLWTVLDELGRILRHLHGWGFSHRDLKAANLLVNSTGWVMGSRGLLEVESAGDHVWLIDLAGVRRMGKVSRVRRARDLGRLHMSFLDHPALTRTDRLRFLRAYLAWGLHGSAGWKDWWGLIDRAAKEKAARTAARGRVVG